MILNSQRTIYGLDLQMAMVAGLPYTIRPNTTINEKLNILPTTPLPADTYPTMRYYAIGIGGLNIVQDVAKYSYSMHQTTDAALFEQVPFVIKPVANDLPADERAKYRMRVVKVIGGVEYSLYYYRLIDMNNIDNDIYKITVANNIPKLTRFSTDTDKLLNPIPRDPSTTLFNTSNTDYITKILKLPFILHREDLVEIEAALTLLYGINHGKHLREIAMCSGVEKDVDPAIYGYSKEAVNSQVMFHSTIDVSSSLLLSQNEELVRSISLGGQEPLILS